MKMTSSGGGRRAWQLPRGVGAGTWDYVDEPSIASEYDSFHRDHPLMALDQALLLEHLRSGYPPEQSLVADFGCGTARVARLIEPLGYRTLNIDLSSHMLRTAAAGIQHLSRAAFVHSNLVELEWLGDAVVDVAVCLFSSIGMIRGRQNRIAFLKHVHRTLKPGGMLLLHVHNRGRSWLDPQGPWWLMSTRLKSMSSQSCEYGDRVYVYRGLPRMFLHIYSRTELQADLRRAGFEHFEVRAIDVTGSRLMPPSALAVHLRAGGYFAVARKPDATPSAPS
jgi:ubiquinone/menaquinone biosynthesis C-methylase UbiE